MSHDDATDGRRISLLPARADLVDAAFLVVLMAIALIGFRTTFGGQGYLVAGGAGLGLGLVLAHLANALRQPMLVVAALTVAVFFLFGGAVALRGSAVGGALPTGSTLRELAAQGVDGWKNLLTTLPPVDDHGPLLVLPYLLGLFGGVTGFSLARRTRPALAPVSAPFLVLVLVILLGSQTPAARLVQGAGFGVVALAWTALRAQRLRPAVRDGSALWLRWATIAALLLLSAGAAVVVGPHAPGSGSHKRLVLRSYVDPPFHIDDYASPLSAFRRYAKGGAKNTQTLFSVKGLPKGVPLRIATLDAYNGITWTASNQPATPGVVPDNFQRVGSVIENPAASHSIPFTVKILPGWDREVWLPDAGALTAISFHGSNAVSLGDNFRYNAATGTGVVVNPDTFRIGDWYSARAVHPEPADLGVRDRVATGGGLNTGLDDLLRSKADVFAKENVGPTKRILDLATYLHTRGKFTDGEPGHEDYLPGHYLLRLQQFVDGTIGGQIAGDDEQYAAAYALMINAMGTPARVVLGAFPENGVVEGKDVHAWVEVQLNNGEWRAIPHDRFVPTQKPSALPPKNSPKAASKLVPPPARGKPHSSLDDSADAPANTAPNARDRRQVDAAGVSDIPVWVATTARWAAPPLLIIGLVCALIIGAKALRRRRRRTRGTPASRFARGWREITDHARDLGERLPGGTRKEQAAALSGHDARGLARTADAFVFGPDEPDDDAAAQFWREIAAARRAMSRTVNRRRRLRAALSLATFRSVRGGSA